MKASIASSNGLANGTGLKEQFDGGFLYLFAGPVPATADEALNFTTTYTEVVKIAVDGSGAGLTFDVPTNGVLGKAMAENWAGTVAFDGFASGAGTLSPTFYRFCTVGDNGRAAADVTTGLRMQGTVGGPNSGAELQLGVAALTSGVSQPVGSFGWRVGAA